MKKKRTPRPASGRQVTASQTDLFLRCQYPWMPGLELPHDSGSEASLYGTAFHWLIGMLLERHDGWMKDDPDGWAREVDFAAKKWGVKDPHELEGHVRSSYQFLRAWLKGGNEWGINFRSGPKDFGGEDYGVVSVEKAIALNPKKYLIDKEPARPAEPVREEDHVYPDLKPGEIAGTVDLEIELPSRGLALTLDHKTGHEAKDFAKPDENTQMLTLATGTPAGGNRVLAIYHADRRSLPVMHAQEVTQAQVDTHVVALRKAQRRVGDGSMTPGWWCAKMYCPARPVCPAASGSIVVAAGEMLAEVVEEVTGELDASGETGKVASTPEKMTALVRRTLEQGLTTAKDVGHFHYFRTEMARLLDMGYREEKKWLDEHPGERPPLPNGKVLVDGVRKVERISKEKIVAGLGAERAEKLFAKLRRRGAMETKEERYITARFEE